MKYVLRSNCQCVCHRGWDDYHRGAWQDACCISDDDAKCVCTHPRIKHRNEDGGEMAGSECLWCDCPEFKAK